MPGRGLDVPLMAAQVGPQCLHCAQFFLQRHLLNLKFNRHGDKLAQNEETQKRKLKHKTQVPWSVVRSLLVPGAGPLGTCQRVVRWYYAGMTKVVSIKMNPTLLLRIDGLASNRSDFIRAAVEEKVKRAGGKGKSAWDALAKTEGLDITIPKAGGQVKRTDL